MCTADVLTWQEQILALESDVLDNCVSLRDLPNHKADLLQHAKTSLFVEAEPS